MRFANKGEKITPDILLKKEQPTLPIPYLDHIPPQPSKNRHFIFNPDLQKLLTGKQLLLDELPFSIKEIHEHYEHGYLIYRKGIAFEKNKSHCNRCGNEDPTYFATFPCARCKEACTYCRKCIMMGRVSACTPLCSWVDSSENESGSEAYSNKYPVTSVSGHCSTALRSESPSNNYPPDSSTLSNTSSHLAWSGTLSEGQQTASNEVVKAISANKELLIWAVCGAGKTEVLFHGIERDLAERKRVCIATPRTDVVLELTPRLQKVFPNIEVASLYGGSEDRNKFSPLTIATTHQLLRFYKAFDTIILDEVDAFPFSVDETLQYAVKNARKDVSSMIYLTATPSTKWQKECRLGKREYVTIPARYHRHPLPVPKFTWCGNWQKLLKKDKLPPNVFSWLQQRISDEKQALLFIPKIELFEKILPILHQLHPKIEAVHAEDPNRKEKVQAMRDKKIPLLATTTILERGVTFPNLDVAVLGAEDRIFTESALVQIAGRVGRSAKYPKGEITFFHYGKTEAMVRAKKQIVTMNNEAIKRGLVDVE